MSRFARRAAVLLLLLRAPAAPAQTAPDAARASLEALRKEHAVAPRHGGVMYGMARAHAQLAEGRSAMEWLKRAAATGLDLDLEDGAFDSLRHLVPFQAFRNTQRKAHPAVSRSAVAFRIPEKELIPEGIAHDPADGAFYVGSLNLRKIVRIDRKGAVTDFAPTAPDVRFPVLGLRVDPARRRLWALTWAGDAFGARSGTSAALVYDLASGKLLRRIDLGNESGKHGFNDLVLDDSGGAYVTDSAAGAIHRIAPEGSTVIEPFVPRGTFDYPNGIALSADGRRLFVADFATGISTVDVATRAVRSMAYPASVSPFGIDGLYLHGTSLIGVQNGAGRDRIVQYALAPSPERIVGMRVLEGGNPRFAIPTTGVVAGNAFHYIANSRLDALGPDGTLRKDATPEEPIVLKLVVPRP